MKWLAGGRVITPRVTDTYTWLTTLGEMAKKKITASLSSEDLSLPALLTRASSTVRQTKTWPGKLAMGVPHKTFKFRLISIKLLRAAGVCSKFT